MSRTRCFDELCRCDGGADTETERLLRRARRLLDLILADDLWVTLDDGDLLRIVNQAEELGDVIAFAQHPSRRQSNAVLPSR